MADDLADVETKITKHEGLENDPHGFILLRLARLVKVATARIKALEDRVTALENK